MERLIRRIEWNYALSWFLANTVAWVVAIGLPSLLGMANAAEPGVVKGVADRLVAAAGTLFIGGAQWWVLSRRFPHSPWWLVGYGLAWYVAFDTGAEIGILVTPDGVTIGVVGGILAGLMQWRLLLLYFVGQQRNTVTPTEA